MRNIKKAGLGARGGSQQASRTKGGSIQRYAHGMPRSELVIKEGSRNDCTQAYEIVNGINAENLIADKAYDTHDIIDSATRVKTTPIIPSKRNRKIQREIDEDLYKLRHIIENTFQKFKEWRGIATRYAKDSGSYMAGLCLRALLMWIKIS